jgi:hypothetical protein
MSKLATGATDGYGYFVPMWRLSRVRRIAFVEHG